MDQRHGSLYKSASMDPTTTQPGGSIRNDSIIANDILSPAQFWEANHLQPIELSSAVIARVSLPVYGDDCSWSENSPESHFQSLLRCGPCHLHISPPKKPSYMRPTHNFPTFKCAISSCDSSHHISESSIVSSLPRYPSYKSILLTHIVSEHP